MVPLLYYLFGSDINDNNINFIKDLSNVWANNINNKIIIDDYVMDKHTHKGINKTTEYFAIEGAYVTPESTTHVSQILKLLYEHVRLQDKKKFDFERIYDLY